MNPASRPQAPAPTPADDQPVTAVARRIGPPLAIGSLVLTVALLAWMALAPTAIAGPVEEAPFTVPATLVVPPDDDGCLRVVTGDGTSRQHCIDELARPDDSQRYGHSEAWFDDEGRLIAVVEDGDDRTLLHVDSKTGRVIQELNDTPADGPSPDAPPISEFVYTDGDRVLRGGDVRRDPATDEVVLDLHGPPGYRLEHAGVSPGGEWLVVVSGRGEVAVAPADGSAPPYLWTEVGDRWLDLERAIRWDG